MSWRRCVGRTRVQFSTTRSLIFIPTMDAYYFIVRMYLTCRQSSVPVISSYCESEWEQMISEVMESMLIVTVFYV